jgi:hypothetical protein
VAAFNLGSLDVPAGLLTPRTTFSLNGRSYESILGGSAEEPQASGEERGRGLATHDDPLIRLLARGVAGYRTAAKALQYALQRPRIVVESLSESDPSGVRTASIRVEGELRDSNEPFFTVATLRLRDTHGELTSVDVVCAEHDLARIAASRLA